MRGFRCSLGLCTKLDWSNSKLLCVAFSHIVCDSSLIHDVHGAQGSHMPGLIHTEKASESYKTQEEKKGIFTKD